MYYEQIIRVWSWSGILLLAAIVAGCDRKASTESHPEALQAPLGSDRPLSVESVMQGARLYQENCAQCHGPEAQGHPDWQNPDFAAAPPLNGTGNEWKRTKAELMLIIKNGAKRNNEPVMPGLNGKLSDQEVESVIAWFQALWPLDVYDRWRKVNAGAPPDKPEKKS